MSGRGIASPATDGAAGTRRILVVEDDPGYQELFQYLLAAHPLALCSSVEEALPRLERESFSMVLADINLLGLTGFEIPARLRQAGLAESCPVLFCSSQCDPETRKKAMEAGAAGFLSKPFSNDTLLSLVETLLRAG